MRNVCPTEGESRRQFEEEVFPAELDYVADRRRSVGDGRPLPPGPGDISTDNDLEGVALSGGGIRSASFGLGFLQSLGPELFRRIDYLSTVSGGGFIGSSISALMANSFYRRERATAHPETGAGEGQAPPAEFPFPLTHSEREAPSISHLRNNSNYMAPGGLGDVFRLLAVLLRGIILNSLSLLPLLFLICLVVLLLYGQQLSDRARFDDQAERIDALLGRYFGDRLDSGIDGGADGEAELEPLLRTLEGEALLRADQGMSRGDLIQQLRPALTFQDDSPSPLIIGNGTAEAPYRLAPGTTRERLARALLEAGVLQRYAIIEEIDLVARELEQDGYRHALSDGGRGRGLDDLRSLADALIRRDLVRPGTDEEKLIDQLIRHWHQDRPPGEGAVTRLKPILQGLYNAEYLNEETLRRLVRDKLAAHATTERPAFYAYGWYQARVGEAFEESWYASNPWPETRVDEELARLTAALRPGCLEADDDEGGRGCLRPGTTRRDVRRLLRSKGIVDDPADLWRDGRGSSKLAPAVRALYFGEYLDQGWVRRSLGSEAPAGGEPAPPGDAPGLAAHLIGESFRSCPLPERTDCCAPPTAAATARSAANAAPEVVYEEPPAAAEITLFDETLAAEEEVVTADEEPAAGDDYDPLDDYDDIDGYDPIDGYDAIPAAETELAPLSPFEMYPSCDLGSLPGSLDELLTRLVLARGTVPVNLLEVLDQNGLRGTVEGWQPLVSPDPEELTKTLAAVWDLLDQRWVDGLLHVYSYGWHRRLVGKPYAGEWCGGAEASAGDGDCPGASDESWAEISRALRDPSRWDPNRLWLPFTWMAMRLALGWVLLFPLLLIAARAVYRRRQRHVARAPNPLEALLSSDQSLNWRALYERTFGALLVLILGVALVELLPYAVHHFHYASLRGQSSRALVVGALSLLVTALAGPALALLERFGRYIALGLLAVAGPLLLLTIFVYAMEHVVYAPTPRIDALLGIADRLPLLGSLPDTLWQMDSGLRRLQLGAALLLFAITTAVSIGLALVIDINATSLHGLYRDRIAKAFMVGLDTEGDIEPEEDLALQQICPAGSGAPYQLINVALNLQGSGDRSLRGRNSDSLFFSRDHVGGQRTGFCRTGDLARVFPDAHLAAAMAVSGAAVSPNMGRYKSGPLAVLMSLLNTRLALWMPHPAAVREWFSGDDEGLTPASLGDRLRRLWRRFRLRAPATLLLRELVGAIHERGPVVNVSDGGHIENTGALELLRRRCRRITIVDGEADPDMAFGGLATLQRIARIDMGIEIEIELDELRPDENGLSRKRSAVGTIHYPARERPGGGQDLDKEEGELIYVKLAVTGAEGETVAEYRARHEAFPHQSTANQAFDESQLEAYRELGYLAGQEMVEAVEDEAG